MFCRKTFQNGGSAIFVKNNLESTEINVLDLAIEGVIEPVILAFSEFIVICIYRPPDGCVDTLFNQLQLCMERIAHKKKHVFICGDLNIDILSKNNKQVKLECFMNEHGLNSLTNKASRVSYNSNTGIDHIITNVPLTNLQSRCDIEVGLSDHLLQNVLVNFRIVTKKSEKMFEFKRVVTSKNECLFLKALTDENWTNVYSAESTNEKFSSFHERNLCKRVKESNEPGLKKYFTEYRKIYKKVIENAKRLSIKSEILNAKNITKTTWKVINRNMGKEERDRSNVEIRIAENDPIITDPKVVADKFNVYFSEIASKLIGNNARNGTSPNNSSNLSMYLSPVTESDIIVAISKLKNKKCSGHDDVTDYIVKTCYVPLVKPLQHLIQSSFNNGIFPEVLKISKILPLFKKENKEELGNYRPVANISVFAKIYEGVMDTKVRNFLYKHNILSEAQFGFIKDKSTSEAVINFIHDIYKAFETTTHERNNRLPSLPENKTAYLYNPETKPRTSATRKQNRLNDFFAHFAILATEVGGCSSRVSTRTFVTGLLFDMSKAFDLVDHNILFKKNGRLWNKRHSSRMVSVIS
ncbi:putative RNA-directed DNA polymerase from transposon BS [Frankliniella fusca]|uniref:RNA-directed DNA polymerase from transposon BS n=1 Tax=Frankliniella fusca TaxID=407009 RepID=A0AAE1HEI8_9NEOP|nr:putative RNA-directed DNA polymerase from transposon BS [Frankliniella fusca]